jgi:8-oxo-dGTP diphosphatase
MSDKGYQAGLPKKRMGAGALIFDENGRFLLVNPTYKEPWEIPGGVVEVNESPAQACVREVREELGLNVALKRLLLVDYLSDSTDKVEALMFIFQGPTLTPAQIETIRLQADELREYRFCAIDEAVRLLNHRLGKRVQRSLETLAQKGSVYVEDQEVVFLTVSTERISEPKKINKEKTETSSQPPVCPLLLTDHCLLYTAN